MTEQLTPETITDEQVDSFFSNSGNFDEPKPKEPAEVVVEPKSEPENPVVEKKYEPKEDAPVNYGALHEERSKRKAEAERAKKAEERAQDLERQLQQYAQKQEVNYDEDPVEALRIKAERMEQYLNAQAQAELDKRSEAKYWDRIRESEIAFKQDKPDFDDAIKFLANSRLEELKDLGWNDIEANKVLRDEIKWIADKAYHDEVNPSERFYSLAKRRGFSGVQQEAPVDKTADIKLDNIKKGMETNRTLPPASKTVKQDLTGESLADMKVDILSGVNGSSDFDKAWSKLFGS